MEAQKYCCNRSAKGQEWTCPYWWGNLVSSCTKIQTQQDSKLSLLVFPATIAGTIVGAGRGMHAWSMRRGRAMHTMGRGRTVHPHTRAMVRRAMWWWAIHAHAGSMARWATGGWAMHSRTFHALAIATALPAAALALAFAFATASFTSKATLANSLVPVVEVSASNSNGAHQAKLDKQFGANLQHAKNGVQDRRWERDPFLLKSLDNWSRHKHLAHGARQHVQGRAMTVWPVGWTVAMRSVRWTIHTMRTMVGWPVVGSVGIIILHGVYLDL
mmetsp:Transcript_10161/g.18032  ORF Transcript_10161/g.18032 Transcript_10161/m.18032 type:complete len:272 (-) Transcript_10161:643-1458(-)